MDPIIPCYKYIIYEQLDNLSWDTNKSGMGPGPGFHYFYSFSPIILNKTCGLTSSDLGPTLNWAIWFSMMQCGDCDSQSVDVCCHAILTQGHGWGTGVFEIKQSRKSPVSGVCKKNFQMPPTFLLLCLTGS